MLYSTVAGRIFFIFYVLNQWRHYSGTILLYDDVDKLAAAGKLASSGIRAKLANLTSYSPFPER